MLFRTIGFVIGVLLDVVWSVHKGILISAEKKSETEDSAVGSPRDPDDSDSSTRSIAGSDSSSKSKKKKPKHYRGRRLGSKKNIMTLHDLKSDSSSVETDKSNKSVNSNESVKTGNDETAENTGKLDGEMSRRQDHSPVHVAKSSEPNMLLFFQHLSRLSETTLTEKDHAEILSIFDHKFGRFGASKVSLNASKVSGYGKRIYDAVEKTLSNASDKFNADSRKAMHVLDSFDVFCREIDFKLNEAWVVQWRKVLGEKSYDSSWLKNVYVGIIREN